MRTRDACTDAGTDPCSPTALTPLLSTLAPPLSSHLLLRPAIPDALLRNMLLLICNNTSRGQINGSCTASVPEVLHTARHTALSPRPSNNGELFYLLRGQID